MDPAGEQAFNEEGHNIHGSCVGPHCLHVPLLISSSLPSDPKLAAAISSLSRRSSDRKLAAASYASSAPSSQPLRHRRRTGHAHTDGMRWLPPPTRHADVHATILDWAGWSLHNSSAGRSVLRRGHSLFKLAARANKPRCTEAFAFFNPVTRARACPAAGGGGGVDYLLFEPRFGVRARRMRLTLNTSSSRGLVTSYGEPSHHIGPHASVTAGAAEAAERAARMELERLRLEVGVEYGRWKEEYARKRSGGK